MSVFGCLEIKVLLGVAVGNPFHQLADESHFAGRQFAVHHVGADQVAQDAAEVFVTGVGEEASGVSQHAHKAAQQPKDGQGIHLCRHAHLLVKEPPA